LLTDITQRIFDKKSIADYPSPQQTIDHIAEEDEASFIAATGLDEIAAKGIHAASIKVTELTSSAE
jgi:hypothetical protein